VVAIIWILTMYSFVGTYGYFRGPYYLHLWVKCLGPNMSQCRLIWRSFLCDVANLNHCQTWKYTYCVSRNVGNHLQEWSARCRSEKTL